MPILILCLTGSAAAYTLGRRLSLPTIRHAATVLGIASLSLIVTQ